MILYRVVAKAACVPTITCGTLKLHIALVMRTTQEAVLFIVGVVIDGTVYELRCQRWIRGHPVGGYKIFSGDSAYSFQLSDGGHGCCQWR